MNYNLAALEWRLQRWKNRAIKAKKRALKAEARLERATNRIRDLQRQLERAQQEAYAGDEARHELGERAARERGEQGIYG